MKAISTLALCLFISQVCLSQEIKVKESSESFSNGSHNALIVTIYECEKSKIEKAWKSKVKDYNPDKNGDKGGEYFFDNCTFKPIGNNTVDVYSKVVEGKGEKTFQLMACFDLGGAYMSSSDHRDKYEFFKKMMYEFAVNLTKDAISDELKDANKILNKGIDKQQSLEKDNKNLDGDIKNYNEKITKAKDEIEKNKKDIEVKKKEIEAQTKVVNGLKAKMESVK